jgi:hypothetical protein
MEAREIRIGAQEFLPHPASIGMDDIKTLPYRHIRI